MRNRGVGQQAFQVGLCQRGQVSPCERRHRDARDERHPSLLRCREHGDEQPQQQREAGRLGRHANIGGDGRRGSLVDVRRPLVKGHSRNFEKQSDCDQNECGSGKNGQLIHQRRLQMQSSRVPGRQKLAHLTANCTGLTAQLNGPGQPKTRIKCSSNISDIRRSTQTVNQGKAVGQYSRAERAEQHIL